MTPNPLNIPQAITAIVHMVGGKQIREQLPEVNEELLTAENAECQEYVDDMEDDQ